MISDCEQIEGKGHEISDGRGTAHYSEKYKLMTMTSQLEIFFLSGSRKGWPSNFAGVISPGWCEAR